ncbi:type II toxin-antitoxin system PemK/MazF family toxin [Paenibacillus polymyxa]|uniref:type II toxin-antitoxin system PemK/MazF family toxin n=1 Tax=Paenibacillus polymyxa TaxID=1406 RepID=UPI00186928FF|nr:type II toxin-antitoxin system PemK/MazF family toxin [Paenibacillus polymyxa]MBE3650948.1 type II toxin-antitoxin system PemK/MazF family toxin [Paenibacillus polymyxa]
MKQRRVVVLSNNHFNQNNSYEYIYVAPILSVHPEKDHGKKWYKRMIRDEHPTNIYIPTIEGYERYISLAQITSIHKGSLLRDVHETIDEERFSVVSGSLNFILDLGDKLLRKPALSKQSYSIKASSGNRAFSTVYLSPPFFVQVNIYPCP